MTRLKKLLLCSPNLYRSGQKVREFPEVECQQNLIVPADHQRGLIEDLVELRWGPRGENSFGQMLQIGVKLVIYAGKIAFFWRSPKICAKECGEVSPF